MAEDEPELLETTLTLSLGATIGLGTGERFQDWVKPEASYAMKWKGIPSEQQLLLASEFIQRHVLAPILESTIIEASSRLGEARKNR